MRCTFWSWEVFPRVLPFGAIPLDSKRGWLSRLPLPTMHSNAEGRSMASGKMEISHEEWLAERVRSALIMLGECVEVNANKRGGIPVLKGTRFTVSQVLAEMAEGRAITEIAEDFEVVLDLLKKLLEGLSISLDQPVPR